MAAATASACPVIGSTNDVLPPNHPEIDLSKDGQVRSFTPLFLSTHPTNSSL